MANPSGAFGNPVPSRPVGHPSNGARPHVRGFPWYGVNRLDRPMSPWLVVALTVGGDQVAKFVIRGTLTPTESIPLIPSVFHLTYVQNTGAAFGLFQGHAGTFLLVSAAVAGWVFLELVRMRHAWWPTGAALALILGGAIGNFIDRVRWGYVVDFIDVRVWPVFNLADSAITIGVGWLLMQTFLSKPSRRS